MTRKRSWPLVALAVCTAVPAAWALEVGDSAPPFEIQEWIKGESLGDDNGKGKVILVEFWKTW